MLLELASRAKTRLQVKLRSFGSPRRARRLALRYSVRHGRATREQQMSKHPPLQFGEAVADEVAEGFAVYGFACEGVLGGFDDGAHLFDGSSARVGYGFGDGRIHFGGGGPGGKIGLEDFQFVGLFVDEVLAAAFGKLVDRFLALFRESLQELNGFGAVERAHFFDFLELQGRFDHAQDAETQFVLRFHSGNDVFLNLFGKRHEGSLWREL